MDIATLLLDLYGRIPPLAESAVADLDADALRARPGADANSIGWLVWHLARVQDHHVAELLGEEQLWVTGEWAAGFGLAPDPDNSGYGHTSDDVATVRPVSAQVCLDYLDAVGARTRTFLEGLGSDDFDRIVDRRWDPPVTLGVRLVSIADDALQHVGQAAYARGLLGR